MSAPENRARAAKSGKKPCFKGKKAGETAEVNSSLHHLKNSPGVARLGMGCSGHPLPTLLHF